MDSTPSSGAGSASSSAALTRCCRRLRAHAAPNPLDEPVPTLHRPAAPKREQGEAMKTIVATIRVFA